MLGGGETEKEYFHNKKSLTTYKLVQLWLFVLASGWSVCVAMIYDCWVEVSVLMGSFNAVLQFIGFG